MDLSSLFSLKAREWLIGNGFKLAGALVILVIGIILAKLITRAVRRILVKRGLDPTLVGFGSKVVYVFLILFVVVMTLSHLGVQTASLIAVLGAAGLAIGLALQGSLSNLASGILIIVLKPFRIGDYITGAGMGGTVEDIGLFGCTLVTPDNQAVFVPNSKLAGDVIVNYSSRDMRRVNLIFGVSYDDDMHQVRSALQEVMDSDSRVLKDQPAKIAVNEFADSSVNFVFRTWVRNSDYWDYFFDTNEAVKRKFDEMGLSIPFPQRDVHLVQKTEDK